MPSEKSFTFKWTFMLHWILNPAVYTTSIEYVFHSYPHCWRLYRLQSKWQSLQIRFSDATSNQAQQWTQSLFFVERLIILVCTVVRCNFLVKALLSGRYCLLQFFVFTSLSNDIRRTVRSNVCYLKQRFMNTVTLQVNLFLPDFEQLSL